MALSSRIKNELMAKINSTLHSIGETIAGVPRNTSRNANKAPYAWEYFLATHMHSMARRRKELAEREAIKNGVIFDKDKSTREPNMTPEQIYDDGVVRINLRVKSPSSRVDPDLMIQHLRKAGVSATKLQAAKEAAIVFNRSAHEFTAYLVTEEGNGK